MPVSKKFGRYTILCQIEKSGYYILYDKYNWIFGKIKWKRLYNESYHPNLNGLFSEMMKECYNEFGTKITTKIIIMLYHLQGLLTTEQAEPVGDWFRSGHEFSFSDMVYHIADKTNHTELKKVIGGL